MSYVFLHVRTFSVPITWPLTVQEHNSLRTRNVRTKIGPRYERQARRGNMFDNVALSWFSRSIHLTIPTLNISLSVTLSHRSNNLLESRALCVPIYWCQSNKNAVIFLLAVIYAVQIYLLHLLVRLVLFLDLDVSHLFCNPDFRQLVSIPQIELVGTVENIYLSSIQKFVLKFEISHVCTSQLQEAACHFSKGKG